VSLRRNRYASLRSRSGFKTTYNTAPPRREADRAYSRPDHAVNVGIPTADRVNGFHSHTRPSEIDP